MAYIRTDALITIIALWFQPKKLFAKVTKGRFFISHIRWDSVSSAHWTRLKYEHATDCMNECNYTEQLK